MRQTIFGESMVFSIANCGIVDYCIEVAESIDACGDLFSACHGFEVACDYGFSPGKCLPNVIGASRITSMQDQLVALCGQ
jgi:hypothetical protein